MDTKGSDTKIVQHVRTFADDLRRAQARGTDAAPAEVKPFTAAPPAQTTPAQMPRITALHAQAPTPTITPIQHAPANTPTSNDDKFINIKQEVGALADREATLVRDTKRKKWSLGKALSESFSDWVADKKEDIAERAEKNNPTPQVAPSTARTQVIRAARKEAVLAPKNDKTVVIEKLRTFASDTEHMAGRQYITTRTPTAEELTPHWSSEEEPKKEPEKKPMPDLRSALRTQPPAIKQARPVVRPHTSLTALPNIPLSNPFAKTQTSRSLISDVAPIAQAGSAESAYLRLQRAVAKKNTPAVPYGRTDDVAPKQAPPQPSRDIAFEKPTFDTQETSSFRTYRGDALNDIKNNNLSPQNIAAAEANRRAAAPAVQRPQATSSGISPRPFFIAGAIMIFIMAIGGFGFFWYSGKTDVPRDVVRNEDGTVRLSSFITTDAQKSIPFSTNRATLLDALTNAVTAAGGGVTQIYPVSDGGSSAVSTSQFMFVLDPRAPG